MHFLPREIHGNELAAEAVDLGQTRADVLFLSFTDSDLATMAEALSATPMRGEVRLASLAQLRHPMSVDLYLQAVARHAKTIVVRLLGGLDYWRYGCEQLHAVAVQNGVRLVIVPGDDREDGRLVGVSTLDAATLDTIWHHFLAGGAANARRALLIASGYVEATGEPQPLPLFGVFQTHQIDESSPLAAIIFYRSMKVAADMAAICALEGALTKRGFQTVSLFVAGTKDPDCASFLESELGRLKPDIVINTTAFSAMRAIDGSPLDKAGRVILQAIVSNSEKAAWQASSRGLGATDLAMNIVMPELDGRITSRAISFKAVQPRDEKLQFNPRRSVPIDDRVSFVAGQAMRLANLSRQRNAVKKIAIMLNDYPGAGGRAGHAVGLDGPASALAILKHLRGTGYDIVLSDLSGTDLMKSLATAPVAAYRLDDYIRRFAELPEERRAALTERFGQPNADPDVVDGAFRFRTIAFGNAILCLQPLRGEGNSHRADYHDLASPPRHGFLAFYWWLRESFGAHALVHLGAHGSLEWLPGKAAALSSACWPEIALGDMPVVYPFIVSDPGEAAQAKRRLSAITIGHLTPPLAAAGLHGHSAILEQLLEEYASASQIDPARARRLAEDIIERSDSAGVSEELDLKPESEIDERLAALDSWLCDLKDLRIKDGLHVFGSKPEGASLNELIEMVCQGGAERDQATALLARCPDDEMMGLTDALSARFVPPGAAGAPSRGRIDCLPTGRNLTTIDPRQSPTRTAEALGALAADAILTRYLQDHGEWPKSLVIDAWGSASIRTGGDELAQAFALMGVGFVRDTTSDRIQGFELLSITELGRPRIDVTLRISGLYRDLFPQQIELFDAACRAIAARDEPIEDNPLRAALIGLAPEKAGLAAIRVFGPAPESYGTGLETLVLSEDDATRDELGEAHCGAAGYAYGMAGQGRCMPDLYRSVLGAASLHIRAHDLLEQDILDAPDYAYATGGFLAAASLDGHSPDAYHLDITKPGAFRIRTVAQEIARIVRGRMTNPRWIAGQMRHGWRGAAELAQSVDSLFAFAATTGLVRDHQFDHVFEAYLEDPSVDAFLREVNSGAHGAIEQRLADAIRRGFWTPRRNSVRARLSDRIDPFFSRAAE